MTIGLAMMVVGFLRKHAQLVRRHGDLSQLEYYPRIDFNDPRQQRWLLGGLAGVLIMVVFIGMMSYEGYHYTESTEFCGAVCHAVMHPEYTAHQDSPHARVECAECHVASGGGHYVRAKLGRSTGRCGCDGLLPAPATSGADGAQAVGGNVRAVSLAEVFRRAVRLQRRQRRRKHQKRRHQMA